MSIPTIAWILVLAALALPAGSPTHHRTGGLDADTLVLANVTVVDPDAAHARAGRDVVVADGRIVAVTATGAYAPEPVGPSAGTDVDTRTVVDGDGGFLIPGLWDSHVHVESVAGETVYALPLWLAHGITTVRDLGSLLTLDELKGSTGPARPRILPHGAMIDGPPGAWPVARVAASAEQGRARVREVAEEGWTAVKVYSLLSRDTYLAIADEAAKQGLAVFGHVPESVTLAEAVAAGQPEPAREAAG